MGFTGLDFKDAAGDTNEGITFFRTAYSSLKLDNIVFNDLKITETFRARTARNFTKQNAARRLALMHFDFVDNVGKRLLATRRNQ